MEYGKWNYREIAALPADELEAFVKHYEQFIRRVSKAGAENNGQGIVFICDWNGFTLSHFASSGGESVCPEHMKSKANATLER